MTPEHAQINRLISQGRVEIRAFEGGKIWTGVFDNAESLIKSIKSCIKKKMNIYNTLNPSTLPATNAIHANSKATKDADIEKIGWMPFDIDISDKDKDYGATDEQIEHANLLTDNLIDYLNGYGFGEPIIGFSGNGYHLLYKVSLDNSPEVKKALSVIYNGLHKRFSNEHADFDRTVRNPSRILRTYGTVNQKGGRRTWCSDEDIEVVDKKNIYQLYKAMNPPKVRRHWVKPESQQEKKGKYIKNMDIVSVFRSNGLYIKETEEPGKHWIICPWSSQHTSTTDTDTVIWEGAWPQFHCSHAHCGHRKIKDIISEFNL